jgi:hypothetical protein
MSSCSKKHETSRFEEYASEITILKTPQTFWCGIPDGMFKKSGEDSILALHFDLPTALVGRLYPDQSFITLLYGLPGDFTYPALFTFDRNGDAIDTLVAAGSCDGEAGYLSTSTTEIGANRLITVTDTTRTWSFDSSYNKIPGTDSTFEITRRFELKPNGKFTSIGKNILFLHN